MSLVENRFSSAGDFLNGRDLKFSFIRKDSKSQPSSADGTPVRKVVDHCQVDRELFNLDDPGAKEKGCQKSVNPCGRGLLHG